MTLRISRCDEAATDDGRLTQPLGDYGGDCAESGVQRPCRAPVRLCNLPGVNLSSSNRRRGGLLAATVGCGPNRSRLIGG